MNAEAARRGDVRTIDVLGALSLAADMALGVRSGHGMRATYIGMHIADELGLPPEQRVDLFYAELLMDAGCTAWTSQMAATILGNDIVARRELFFATDPSEPRELLRWLAGYMATGERLDTRLRRSIDFAPHGRSSWSTACATPPIPPRAWFVFEQWNGHGPYERRTAAIPLVSRIVFATIFLEVFHQLGGREAAVTLARGRSGKTLDPQGASARRHAFEPWSRGPREALGAEDATRYFQAWFGSYDRIDVLASSMDLIGDRHHLMWRLRVLGDGQQRSVEQQAFATVRDEQILELDLLCSGFRAEESAPPVVDAVLDGGDAGCATLTPLINASLRGLRSGQVLELTTREPGAEPDITSWSRLSGNVLLGGRDAGGTKHFCIRKK